MVSRYSFSTRSGVRHRFLTGHFVFTSFASAFLLKVSVGSTTCAVLSLMSRPLQLLRPEFSWLVEPDDKTKIFDLIGRLIQTLNSPEVAVDNKHTPKLHAKFLAGLLTKYHQDSNQDQLSQEPLPPSKHSVGGNPNQYEGQPQPSSTSAQYFGHGPGTTPSNSMPQSGFDNVSYSSDPNLSSQGNVAFPHDTPRYQLQTSDGMVTTQDSAVNAMADLSEEDMLATLRAIGNPNWWSNVMMPGYADFLSTMVLSDRIHKQILLAKSIFGRLSGKHWDASQSLLPLKLLSVRCYRFRPWV